MENCVGKITEDACKPSMMGVEKKDLLKETRTEYVHVMLFESCGCILFLWGTESRRVVNNTNQTVIYEKEKIFKIEVHFSNCA